MDIFTCLIHRGPRLNNAKHVTVKEKSMSKNQQSKNVSQQRNQVKPELTGYYYDGKRSYKIYNKENRSYRVQDK